MLDVVDLIFEFVALRDPDGITLTEDQRHRLEALARLLASPVFEVREHARIEVRGPVEFTRRRGPPSSVTSSGRRVHSQGAPLTGAGVGDESETEDDPGVGHVMDIGAGGLCISTWRPLFPGEETTVRFADMASGYFYEFPCRVAWSRAGESPAMGLTFSRSPSRERLGSRSGLGRLSFGLQLKASTPPAGLEMADTGLIPKDLL